MARSATIRSAGARPRGPRWPRVLVGVDQDPLRRGVRLALQGREFRLVGECADAAELVDAAWKLRPEIVLVDIDLAGGGIDAARRISESLSGVRVVMLGDHDEDDLLSALRAGAVGYLSKRVDPAGLPSAIRAVLGGEAALPRKLVLPLVEALRAPQPRAPKVPRDSRAYPLTPREFDVLDLLVDGCSTFEIANRLDIEPVTVRSHVASIVQKLQVADRDAAIELVHRQRWSHQRRAS